MSQLVFQSTLGGSITFIGADTSNSYTVVVPAQSGTLLYQDGSNNFTVQNLIVNGTATFNQDAYFSGTGEVQIPSGTTAQRSPTPATGMIRANTTTNKFEGYIAGAWGQLGGGATGGGSDAVFVENSLEVTTSYTIPTGKSASSVGPITIDSGAVITIPSGSRWVVL